MRDHHHRDPAGKILLRPFQSFFAQESASGILLLAAALVALVWANSPLAPAYFEIWETHLVVGVGDLVLDQSLHHWINDGLMAVFFFVVGLEIKREVLMGELAAPRKAALTVAAALGGMAMPTLVYALLNARGVGAAGWGIPMATDIAFALGVLALLGSRIPLSLKVFVTAIAIMDDLGAVLVIAFFYTAELSWGAIELAAVMLILLALLNRGGVLRPLPYALLGVVLWLAFLASGVHATIAGILLALTIPARRAIDDTEFLQRTELLVAEFAEAADPGLAVPTPDQRNALHSLEVAVRDVEAPLPRIEHALHPWVAFFIMPVFALANAGVSIGGDLGAVFGSPISLGVILGLFLGKPVGILTASWIAVRTGLGDLPSDIRYRHLWGVSLLCGIGFTMSLFIATIALPDHRLLDTAKIGILTASLLSGIAGALILARAGAPTEG